jgi:flagellar biosynthetic protein FliR
MSLNVDFAWIEAVMLAGVRMTAFLVIAPPFSSRAIPARVKAMLAVGLALAVSPRVVPGYQPGDAGSFLFALIGEIVLGALLGFLVFVAFSAVQAAGSFIDLFGGFQLAQAFDPQSMVNGAQFSRLFQMTAIALLFASGAYQLIIGGLVRSFTAVPIGGDVAFGRTAATLLQSVSEMFVAALQIAGPLIIVLFLADIGLGLLTRIAPALNAFSLSFPVKIGLTLMLGGIAFAALPAVVNAITGQAVELMTGVR